MPETDRDWLTRFVASGCDEAFRGLVDRHLPLVHATAHRITANSEAANDIAQTVFLRLAKKAARIPTDLPLTAWFHRETHSAAVDHVRSEVRRQNREQTAAELDAMKPDKELWNHLTPVIDESIESLPPKVRALVLLRFYSNKSYPEIARELGIQEDAARMRTNRALEKLREILGKRGITTTAAALATTLPAHAISAPPAALAASIASTVSGLGGAASGSSAAGWWAMMSKAQLAALAAWIGAMPVIGIQHRRHSRLEVETAALRAGVSKTFVSPDARQRERRPSSPVSVALTEILAMPDASARIDELLRYIDLLTGDDIPAVLEELHGSAPEWDTEARMLTHILFTRWAREDPETAFASLDSLDFKRSGGDPNSLLSSLAAIDPSRAANWLDSPFNSISYFPAMGHVLAGTIGREWVRQDPEAALSWAAGLSDDRRAGAYTGIFGTLVGLDTQLATSAAMKLEGDEERKYFIGEIARDWARRSPDESLNWADGIADPVLREAALDAALREWTLRDAAAAESWSTAKGR